MFECETKANQSLNPSMVKEYLTHVFKESGKEAASATMHFILLVAAKYLTMMVSYHLNENDPTAVESNFKLFNDNFYAYCEIYKSITDTKLTFGRIDIDINQINIIR